MSLRTAYATINPSGELMAETSIREKAYRLLREGDARSDGGHFGEAIACAQEAYGLLESVGDLAGQAVAVGLVGDSLNSLGDFRAALDCHRRRLSMSREARDAHGEIAALRGIGISLDGLGDYRAAIEHHERSLALSVQIESPGDRQQALSNIGIAYQALGDSAKAIDYYKAALKLSEETSDAYGLTATHSNLGSIYFSLGNYQLALEHLQLCLEYSERYGFQVFAQDALCNLASVHLAFGESDLAVTYLDSALAAQTDLESLGAARIFGTLGVVFDVKRDFETAKKYFNSAFHIFRRIGEPQGLIAQMVFLGKISLSQGLFDEALENFKECLDVADRTGDLQSCVYALINLGIVHSHKHEHRAAQSYLARALKLARELPSPFYEWHALHVAGADLMLHGDLPGAEEAMREAIVVLERVRAGLGSFFDFKVSLLDAWPHSYVMLQYVLALQGKIEEALEVSERGRATLLAELLFGSGKLIGTGARAAEPISISEIRAVAKSLNATIVEYSLADVRRTEPGGTTSVPFSQLLIYVVEPAGGVHLRRVDLRPLLEEGKGRMLRYLFDEDELAGTARRDALFVVTSPADAPGAVLKPDQGENLRALYDLLIEPIEDLLPDDPNKPVVFIPQQAMFLIPFSCLRDCDGVHLIERHPVSLSPSIRILQLVSRPCTTASDSALIIGNPTMPALARVPGSPSYALSPLPFAEREAANIGTLLQTRAFTGDEATKTLFQRLAPGRRILHLATHGLVGGSGAQEIPGALALSPLDGGSGLLTSREVMSMRLDAELVVLSACNTGAGKITGDGVIGLSRSFLLAGASAVIVSLWSVPDRSTGELMVEFYKNFKGGSNKGQALREAMLATKKIYADPLEWASFVLIGNPI